MSSNFKKKVILVTIVLVEVIVGLIALFNFYQQKIVNKTPDQSKIAVIKKDNLVFPDNQKFKYYYEVQPNTVETDNPDWLDYEAKYTYNADGLNERFDYVVDKPIDTFRIVALGDSFTFGHFVNTKDNWTEQLEDLLNQSPNSSCGVKKFEVINLGMPGFDVPYIVKRYQDIGAKYKPDLIIWLESGSGFVRLNEILKPIIDACEEKEVDSPNYKKEFYYCWHKADKEISNKYSHEEINQMITDQLDSFFQSLDKEKVLYFTYEDFTLSDNAKNNLKQWRERYPQTTFSSTIPEPYRLKQVLPDDHPSVAGHRTMANAIYDYLKNNFIKECNLP